MKTANSSDFHQLPWAKVLHRQDLQATAALIGLWILLRNSPTNEWVYVCVAWAAAPLQQFYVTLCWRMELFGRHLSRKASGNTQQAFQFYKVGFVLTTLFRLGSLLTLAVNTSGRFSPTYSFLAIPCLLSFASAVYTVVNFLGVDAMIGKDHFEPKKYSSLKRAGCGLFHYTDNPIYTFGLAILYVPGLIQRSYSALFMACFYHFYAWALYYCTELPDIYVIYGCDCKQ